MYSGEAASKLDKEPSVNFWYSEVSREKTKFELSSGSRPEQLSVVSFTPVVKKYACEHCFD